MDTSEETVKVVFDSIGGIMIMLGDHGVELTRAEAEQLFVDLGHALQDQDMMMMQDETESKLP